MKNPSPDGRTQFFFQHRGFLNVKVELMACAASLNNSYYLDVAMSFVMDRIVPV